MAVTLSRNFGPLADLELSNSALMREVGLLARERIYQRTVAGRDQDDNAFKPYTPSYAALKGRELGTTGVNLQVSGAMLNAMVILEITDTSVTLGFNA